MCSSALVACTIHNTGRGRHCRDCLESHDVFNPSVLIGLHEIWTCWVSTINNSSLDLLLGRCSWETGPKTNYVPPYAVPASHSSDELHNWVYWHFPTSFLNCLQFSRALLKTLSIALFSPWAVGTSSERVVRTHHFPNLLTWGLIRQSGIATITWTHNPASA